MQRRDYLATATGIAAGALGTGAMLRTTSTASAAVAMHSLSITDADVTTEDGTVEDVLLDVSGSWEYDLPAGENPDTRQVVALAGTDGTDAEPIAATVDDAMFLSSHGDYELAGSLLEADALDAAAFAADEPGATTTTTVWIAVVFSVFDPDEKLLATAEVSETGTIDVTEAEYKPSEHGSVGGDAEFIVVE